MEIRDTAGMANRAKSMLDRREQLLREGAIASEVVDNARRDYEVAMTDLDAAKQQLSLVQEGPRSEEIRVAEESVRQARLVVLEKCGHLPHFEKPAALARAIVASVRS